MIDRSLLAGLQDIVGADQVLTDADDRASFETDWTGRFVGSTPAVVRPGSTAEVAAIIDLCRNTGVAIVPQGGNTGLVGGGVPLHGEIVLSLSRLNGIGPVDIEARQVTVGAGAILADVRDAAARAGLAYAVDLGARGSATIGGTIATNAGGINLIRYGGTREQIIGVEAVLGTGETISHLGGLHKDNTGYHLAGLLCGSEGTLGIVTAARLRLVAQHQHRVAALIGFATVEAAIAAVASVRAELDSLEAAEIMLAPGVQLVAETFGLVAPLAGSPAVLLLLEVADHDDPTDAFAAVISAIDDVVDAAVATDATRRTALWRFREEHTLAISTLGTPHKLDVTLPISRLAEFMATVPLVVADDVADVAPDARTWLFGHVGDGNIHVNITGLDRDDERCDDAVLRYVASLGGSISAEHGIGTAKVAWLHLNRSPAEIGAMRAIKSALDPAGILNPHVLLP
ncbi:MAG: FAD-binding oxidoreductase [Ilumatobacteraceae bacterium]